jgi:hypothetical protein
LKNNENYKCKTQTLRDEYGEITFTYKEYKDGFEPKMTQKEVHDLYEHSQRMNELYGITADTMMILTSMGRVGLI